MIAVAAVLALLAWALLAWAYRALRNRREGPAIVVGTLGMTVAEGAIVLALAAIYLGSV